MNSFTRGRAIAVDRCMWLVAVRESMERRTRDHLACVLQYTKADKMTDAVTNRALSSLSSWHAKIRVQRMAPVVEFSFA